MRKSACPRSWPYPQFPNPASLRLLVWSPATMSRKEVEAASSSCESCTRTFRNVVFYYLWTPNTPTSQKKRQLPRIGCVHVLCTACWTTTGRSRMQLCCAQFLCASQRLLCRRPPGLSYVTSACYAACEPGDSKGQQLCHGSSRQICRPWKMAGLRVACKPQGIKTPARTTIRTPGPL